MQPRQPPSSRADRAMAVVVGSVNAEYAWVDYTEIPKLFQPIRQKGGDTSGLLDCGFFHMTTATIIGSGPNGLSAAIVLAAAGIDTKVLELNSRIGGACSTAETTLPGFRQ